jgi:hypothetical protein
MKIINVVKSDRKGKKYTAILDNAKEVHFGSDVSQSYVEGASDEKREAYLRRHMANSVEKHRIDNLIMSPSLLSAYLLWGSTRNLEDNIKILNRLIKDK